MVIEIFSNKRKQVLLRHFFSYVFFRFVVLSFHLYLIPLSKIYVEVTVETHNIEFLLRISTIRNDKISQGLIVPTAVSIFLTYLGTRIENSWILFPEGPLLEGWFVWNIQKTVWKRDTVDVILKSYKIRMYPNVHDYALSIRMKLVYLKNKS